MPQQDFPQVNPKTLKPNPWNTNVVSPDNERKLEESIRRFGFTRPIVVRELDSGELEILGGAHTTAAAIRLKIKTVPVFNLGKVDDTRAKEISLIDNARYGADDTLQLAALLESLGVGSDDLISFLPYTNADLDSILSSTEVDLDALMSTKEEEEAAAQITPQKTIKTHVIMRFKVPIDDADEVGETIKRIMKNQGFTSSDSLTNAGDSLVYLVKLYKLVEENEGGAA